MIVNVDHTHLLLSVNVLRFSDSSSLVLNVVVAIPMTNDC